MSAIPANGSDQLSPRHQADGDNRRPFSAVELGQIRRLRIERGLSFDDAASALGYSDAQGAEGSADADTAMTSSFALADNKLIPGDRLILVKDPYGAHSEQIRALRTELLLRPQDNGRANSVAMLSPCAGEGRSLMAAELAISFAHLGRPTLLVDTDFRHPQQHVLFGADNRHGLSSAIAHNSRPRLWGIEGLPYLSLLTSGPTPSNPLELLSDNRFESLFEGWQQQYEFIVFDTPPIHQYSDGLAVAMIVGRVLALSRARYTPYSKMQRMLRRLSATQSQILGAIVNHF